MKRRIAAFLLIIVLTGVTVAMKIITSPRLDEMIQTFLVEQAEDHLGVRLTLGSMDHNILLTRFTLEDVVLTELRGEGREIKVRRLIVAFDPYAIFRGTFAVNNLQLEGIDLQVTHHADGSVSVDPLLPFWQPHAERGAFGKPVRVQFKRFTLIDSHLSYRDVQAGLHMELDDVLIGIGRNRFDPPDRKSVSISGRSGEMTWRAFPEGRSVDIEAFHVNLAYSREEILLSTFSLESGPLQVELSGRVPLEEDASISGSLEVAVDLDRLPWLIEGGKGRVLLSGRIAGPLESPVFKGTLTSDDIRLGNRALGSMDAALEMDSYGGRLTDFVIRYRDEDVRGKMDIGFTRDLPFTLEVEAENYPIYKMIREFRKEAVKPEGEISFSCVIEGRLSPGVKHPGAVISLTGRGDIPLSPGVTRSFDMNVRGSYADDKMALEVLRASFGSAILTVGGGMDRDGISLTLRMEDEELGQWGDVLPLRDMSGELIANGEISGSWQSPKASLDVVVKGLSGGGYTVDLMEAHVDVDRSGVSFPLASLKVRSSAVTFHGEYPWDSQEEAWLSVGISSGRIEDFLGAAGSSLGLSGEATIRINLSKRGDSLVAAGDSILRDVAIYGERFQECRFKLEILDGGLHFNDVKLIKDGRVLKGRANITDGRFQVRLATEDPLLLDGLWILKDQKVPFTGEMLIEAEGEGTLDGSELSARAQLQWDSISFEGRPWHGGKGTFILRNRTLEGRADLIDGKFSARAVAQLSGDIPFSGTIRTTRRIDTNDLNDFLGLGIPSEFASGQTNADARARGILSDLDKTVVEGILENLIFEIRGLRLGSEEGLPFTYNPENGIRFPDLRLSSGVSDIEGSLLIASGGLLEGTVSGVIDLVGFSYIEPTVDTFHGMMDIQVRVSGTLSEPELSGFLNVRDTSCVAHLPFPLEVKGLSGRIEVVRDRLHFDSLSGTVGGGSLDMTGDLFFRGLRPVQGHLEWRGESIPVNFPEGLWTLNRGHLTMRFSEGKGDVRGVVQMDEGKYTREIDLDNLAGIIAEGARTKEGAEGSAPEGNGRGSWLSLDIEMTTVNPIDVDIKLVRGLARGALRLQGTADRPLLSGRLEMVEGVVLYRGKSFEITHGTVGFFNPYVIEPNFDVSAKAEVSGFDRDNILRDYEVELVASGVPTKFQLDLLSSPPLSETDVISLLTWGAVGEQAFAEGSGLSATEATLILTRELMGKLESEVQQITGFDRFVIDPAFISSKGERVPRVRVDKKLGERLSMSASTPILSGEESEILLRYRVSDTFSLLGEQGGEREFGLDLDFKFEIP